MVDTRFFKYLMLASDKGTPKSTLCDQIKAYLWMLWDGLEFFGFDDTKLARLNGHPTSYMDKFKNKKWIGTTVLGLTIVLYVLISSIEKLGSIKF